MKFILVLIYLILSVSGLIFMKLGGNPGTVAIKDGNISMVMNLISGLGFICYIGSFLLFTRIVVMFDLSYILPLVTGIVQVLVLLAAHYIFKENISFIEIIGASLIIIGIVIMNLNSTNNNNIEKTKINTQQMIQNK
ncbi:MAG: hypothetical protein RSE41_08100 [Clostridia bacterium]